MRSLLLLGGLVAWLAACSLSPSASPSAPTEPSDAAAVGAATIPSTTASVSPPPDEHPCPSSAAWHTGMAPPQVTLGRGANTALGYADSFNWRWCGSQGISESDYFLPDGPRLAAGPPLTFSAPPEVIIHRVAAAYWPASNGRHSPIDHSGAKTLDTRPGTDQHGYVIAAPRSGTWSIGVEIEMDDVLNGVTWNGSYTFRLTIVA